MENDELLKEAIDTYKNAGQDDRNAIIGAVQKAGQKWLPDEVFKEHFETGKRIAADRGDNELSMQFWIFGSPMSGYRKGEGTVAPVVFGDWDPQSQEDKKRLMMGLGLKIADDWPDDQMLTTIVHISEAWVVKRDKDSDTTGVRPSEEPDRIEVALVHAMSMDQRISYWQGEIKRDKDGKFIGYEDLFTNEHDPADPKTFAADESFRDYLSEWIMLGYSLGRDQKKKGKK